MTHPGEARNGPPCACTQVCHSTSPTESDGFSVKRSGLTVTVYRAASGQWAWRLANPAGEEIGGGSGYDDEGDAASAALAELDTHITRADESEIDCTVTDIDAIVQSETRAIEALLALIVRDLRTLADETIDARRFRLHEIATAAHRVRCTVGELRDTVNSAAECVGLDYRGDAR
jgi:hypothetical protein